MGRYAFFNTGFEYKFGFGKQSSEDILLFGGLGSFGSDIHDSCFGEEEFRSPYHQWSSADMELIESRLQKLAIAAGIEDIKIEDYPKDIGGTSDLRSDIYDRFDTCRDLKYAYMYLLGCIIYHQLLFTDKLSCEYEN